MNRQLTPPPPEPSAEISALIETLLQTERRLEELTAGEVDTVADSQGRTLMLRRAQEEMRHRDMAKQAAILNALPAHIALVDSQGIIVSANEAWRQFAGTNAQLGPGYAIGVSYLAVCEGTSGPDSSKLQQVAKGIRSVLAGELPSFSVEYPCHTPTDQRWFLMTVTPLSDALLSGAVIMHVDVTVEKKAVEELRTSESRFRQMADNITDVFFLKSLDGTEIYYVSPAYEQIWGRTCDSLYVNPASWAEAIHPDDRHLALARLCDGYNTGFDDEFRIIRPDGEVRWIRVRGFSIPDVDGNPYRTAGVCTDITQRKQATDDLRTSEARFRSLTTLSSDWYWEQDEEYRFVRYSGGELESKWGNNQPVTLGKRRWELAGITPLSENWDQHKAHLDARKSFRNFEYQRILEGGEVRYVSVSGEPIFHADDRFSGYRGVATDITERKRAIQVLHESERRFSALLGTVKMAAVMLDRDARITYCNEFLLRLTGWQNEEVIGRDWFETFMPAELGDMKPVFIALLANLPEAWHRDQEIYTRSKERRLIRWSNSVLRSPSGEVTGTASIGEDITERVRAEEALRVSELQSRQLAAELDGERSRLIAAQRVAKVGSWETDLMTMSVIWSDETHRIFETDAATFRPNHNDFLELVHPEDRARVNEAFARSLGEPATYKDIQHRLLLPDGRIKFVEERWRVNFDQQDRPVNAIGTSQDITERQRAEDEIRQLNTDLEHRVEVRTADLKAVNRELEAFDYSISHDLKAPIRHVEGFSKMLIEDYGDKLDARGRDYLQRMQSAGQRMGQLVDDLLSLSLISRSELNRREIDLSTLALQVIDNLQQAEPGRDIVFVVEPGLTTNGDRGLLQIVLENLIGNARKFTAGRIGAKVEFGKTSVESGPVFFVRDNGAGFDSAYADKLFAPFQRMHAQSEFSGTGIGLATVRRVITRHGGQVWAEGGVDRGATIHFTLPS